jgi:hypothetical protein
MVRKLEWEWCGREVENGTEDRMRMARKTAWECHGTWKKCAVWKRVRRNSNEAIENDVLMKERVRSRLYEEWGWCATEENENRVVTKAQQWRSNIEEWARWSMNYSRARVIHWWKERKWYSIQPRENGAEWNRMRILQKWRDCCSYSNEEYKNIALKNWQNQEGVLMTIGECAVRKRMR